MLRAIEIIEASIKSHQDWIDFVKENPEFNGETHGSVVFHRDRVNDYKLAKKEIEQIQANVEELKAEMGVLKMGFIPENCIAATKLTNELKHAIECNQKLQKICDEQAAEILLKETRYRM